MNELLRNLEEMRKGAEEAEATVIELRAQMKKAEDIAIDMRALYEKAKVIVDSATPKKGKATLSR